MNQSVLGRDIKDDHRSRRPSAFINEENAKALRDDHKIQRAGWLCHPLSQPARC